MATENRPGCWQVLPSSHSLATLSFMGMARFAGSDPWLAHGAAKRSAFDSPSPLPIGLTAHGSLRNGLANRRHRPPAMTKPALRSERSHT